MVRGVMRVSPMVKLRSPTSLKVTVNGGREKLGNVVMIVPRSRLVPRGPMTVMPGRCPPPYFE